MYAVIETSGRQYRVELGSEIELDRLDAEPGSTIELGRVLLIADGDDAHIGLPVVDGARVTGEVLRQDRGDKIVVFKYQPKARRRVKHGHRSELTIVRVSDIVLNGRSAASEAEAQAKQDSSARNAAEKEAARKAAADQALAEKLAADEAAKEEAAAQEKDAAKKATTGRKAAAGRAKTGKAEQPTSAEESVDAAPAGSDATAEAGADTARPAASRSAAKPAAKPSNTSRSKKKDD